MGERTTQTDYESFRKLEDPQDSYNLIELSMPERKPATGRQRIVGLFFVGVGYLAILQIIPFLPPILSWVFKVIAWVLVPIVWVLAPIGWLLKPIVDFFDRGVSPFQPVDSSVWSGWSIEWLGVIFLQVIDSIAAVVDLLPLPSFVSAFSITLILTVLLAKAITYPMERAQKRAIRMQALLQPQIARLQQIYKSDREKMSQEQMKLYQQAKVNPFSGCLSLLIVLPITFGVWSAVQEMISRGGSYDTHFLWLDSTITCDPNVFCDPQSSAFAFPVPILILLYTLLMWDTSSTSRQNLGRETSGMIQGVTNIMKILYSISLATMPAAIVLYLLLQTILALLLERVDQKNLRAMQIPKISPSVIALAESTVLEKPEVVGFDSGRKLTRRMRRRK